MKIRLLSVPVLLSAAGFCIFMATSCYPTQEAPDTKDMSYLYNPLKNSVNPRYGVLNLSEGSSVLTMKFSNSDLYFTEANPTGQPMAMMMVSVRLYNITMGRTLADTALYDLEIARDPKKSDYLFKVPLTVEKGIEYIIEIKIYDKVRQTMMQSFVPFNTVSEFNRYNFLARGHFLKNELLMPVVRKNEYSNIVYIKGGVDSLIISYFPPHKETPYPPAMALPDRPSPVIPDTIIAVQYSDTMPVMFPNRGIYHIRVNRKISEGLTLFNFGDDYPAVDTPEEMIRPLAYLASEDEMSALKAAEYPKIALDDFWLKCGGNVEKARELIRIFYTRVLYANYYFTSYKEGWMTDRGMIYIIYGPPDKLYKSATEETWGYMKPSIKSSWGASYTVEKEYLFFTFSRRESTFTENEYSLNRSETVVSFWDQAILSWRNGIVFRLDNPTDI